MSESVRVMHFADTHFGVELHGRLDPETGLHTRLKDFTRSLQGAIELALADGIHLAVFAGDAYKTRDPRQTDQREFAGCIRTLTNQGVPVVLLAGNHDMPAIRGRAHAVEIYRTLGVEGVHVISRPEVITVSTARGDVRIAGMPYLIKGYSLGREEFLGKTLDETRQLLETRYAEYIGSLADELRASDDLATILLGHFWARGARLSSFQQGYLSAAEPQVDLSSLTDPVFDYVALGHIHRHQDLNPNGQPHVVYAGSPDRIDFGEKDEQKGVVIADVYRGGADYRFIHTPHCRPMLDIAVDADCEDPTERIVSEIKKHRLRDAVVKLTYTISHERAGLVREKEVREALAGAFLVVSIARKVQRSSEARSQLLTESRSPREALSLYIDTRENLKPRRDLLMRYAEPLLQEELARDAA